MTAESIQQSTALQDAEKPILKICVTSSDTPDQGKTTVSDELVAPRLRDLVRFEIETDSASSSRKLIEPPLPASAFEDIQLKLLEAMPENSVLCDIGATGYKQFFEACRSEFSLVADYFDRVLLVVKSGGTKGHLPVKRLTMLLEEGIDPARISVVINYANFTECKPELTRDRIHDEFAKLYSEAKLLGVHVCDTPIYASDKFYGMSKLSSRFTAANLVTSPNLQLKVVEMMKENKTLADSVKHSPEDIRETLRFGNIQEMAKLIINRNLQQVWDEIMAEAVKLEFKTPQ